MLRNYLLKNLTSERVVSGVKRAFFLIFNVNGRSLLSIKFFQYIEHVNVSFVIHRITQWKESTRQ